MELRHAPAAVGRPPASGAPRTIRTAGRTSLGAEIRAILELPLTSYCLILTSSVALVVIGLIMVLSATSITSYDGTPTSSYSVFFRQATFAAAGIAAMLLLSSASVRFLRRMAWPAMAVSIGLVVLPLIPGVGHTVNGSTNWVQVGPIQGQPSEVAKVAVALWLGMILARKADRLDSFRELAVPIVPVLGAVLACVLAGGDLGTSSILILLSLVALFTGGVPLRYFAAALVPLAVGLALLIVTSPYRLARVRAIFTGEDAVSGADALGQHWQSSHGLYALASGGWTGVGLGASREKWSWLPEAHNDFIFAIIGEELGLLGGCVVIGLFAVLGGGLLLLAHRSQDRMVQVTTMGVFAWVIGQAAVNIGVVTTLLPVIGVPLPFVSYGGSAVIGCLMAIGLTLAFARAEPGAREALARQRRRTYEALTPRFLRRRRSGTGRSPRATAASDVSAVPAPSSRS